MSNHKDTSASPGGAPIELTLEELAKFDGKDGRPAYVAVHDKIYDMSDSDSWYDGEHYGYEAGNDLTDIIENESPHGVSELENVPEIGRIVQR
ncbi:MAG: cytochrome B5 [Clostridiales bacterium]|nr:cytochrome B5 [Clostridiales bacterium]